MCMVVLPSGTELDHTHSFDFAPTACNKVCGCNASSYLFCKCLFWQNGTPCTCVLVFFLSAVSSQHSSQWTVSSTRMTFFPSWDHKTMAGLKVVDSDSSWNWSFLLRSAFISHPWVNCSRFSFDPHITTDIWLSFTKAMMLSIGFVLTWCFFLLSCSKMWPSGDNHLTWHRLYLSWVKAILHHDMCSMVYFV